MSDIAKSLIVTDHGQFYRVYGVEHPIYFAKNAQNLEKAKACGLPTEVGGFAVYDTTVSTSYAVALYATLAEAHGHQPTPAPRPPTSVFNDLRTATDTLKPAKRTRKRGKQP